MQTETVFACYVEIGDFIVEENEPHEVVNIIDHDDHLIFVAKGEEGDVFNFHRPPFEHMCIVLSFEETFEFEDVDIDA